MTLRLSVENLDRLPDGGPLRVEVKGRGLDIGRDAHLDWTLPDPTRYVSGKHCEIRFREGEYWLYDVSTNGTYLNGSQFRLDAPYRLQDGDRLVIGPYVVAAAVEGGERRAVSSAAAATAAAPGGDVWGAVGDSAAPDSRDAYRVRGVPVAQGDFLDFATGVDAPAARAAAPAFAWTEEPPPDEPWMAAPAPPAPEPPPPLAPHELPLVATPRPIRPIEASPLAEEPVAIAPTPPPAKIAIATPVTPKPPVAAPVASPQAPPAVSAPLAGGLLERIAAAAGIPPSALANRRTDEIADEIGAVLRLTATNLIQMIGSRTETKSLIRSANHTMYRPAENNPLKFSADVDHALELMFGPPNRVYLKPSAAVTEAFDDLKTHNMLVFGAMQAALDALFEDLSPDKVDASTPQEKGIGGMVASRKARLWEAYAARWQAMTKRSDGRLNDAFMTLFAQAYDKLNAKTK
jgi:type VI secretion system protein ImpI